MSIKVLFSVKIDSVTYSNKGENLSITNEFDENDIRLIVKNRLEKEGFQAHYDSIKYVLKDGQLFIEGSAYKSEGNFPDVSFI